MSEIARLFGARAGAYASFRPAYPAELFAWLAEHSPARQRALDIACGNGQASRPLLAYFEQVLACDASVEQLTASQELQGIELFAADAEALPLAASSLDLIVVAQALHWFATPAFFAEVRRLLKPGGLFCAWCYSLMRIDPALDAVIDEFYSNTLNGYWPQGRASVDAGYRDLQAPFSLIQLPPFAIGVEWSFEHLLGYLRTWSAVQRWERQHGHDPVTELTPTLRHAWGDLNQPRFVRWPLHFLAGFPTH
ncbi:class I SAM-dependent methyltransferase [Pseudomonas cavernicola]|uniref:Class I SAM-dependent methyltransferase n=1 Tax=Pseudomonas cavernicola TaxID=2320866 RepID=A0A418XD88_9PSED|nr:class I SAM-dependent methyltransferase [Pseudomonas cavernicola]RJG10476.1 class I SAM-dependent methyltransferase [Pseudomonas cavernicola]